MNKQTVRDLDAAGKKVFVRVDFNVPIEDGKVTDDSRVRAAIPTIALLLSKGAAVILASHLGRPNGRVVDTYRLRPVAERLSMLLGRYVPITGDALGVGTQDAVNRLKPGQVLMLENLRFHSEEEANDPKFAKTLAGYADAYVNDAFGTAHRAHASTVGITEYLPAYAGLLLEREVQVLSRLLESPERPFAAVLGGAKVSGKIKVLDSLTERVDTFVVGGGMANTFLVARGNTVGKSLLEKDRIDDARRVLEAAEKKGINFVLPVDVVVAKEVTRGAERKLVPAHKIPNSWSAVDVGPQTRELFEQALDSARTVFWNGPLGVFEVPTFGDGTRAMARYLARRAEEGATVVVGGGDSVAAVEQLGLAPKMTHISTGGGASLEFLENGDLPGIAALLDREPAPAPAGTEPTAAPAATPAPSAATPVGPAATTAKQQPAGPAQPAKPVPARVGVRALDATTPIATVSAPGDGAGTSRRPAPASAGRGNGRQPAAKPAGARETTGRARATGTGRAAGTTKAASSRRPATPQSTAQRRKSAAPAAGAARRSTSGPRRAKAAAPASGRATGKKSPTSSTRAGARPTGASKRSTTRASTGGKPSTRRVASTGKAAAKRTAGKKAATKRATGAAKPATTRGKATAKPATKRAAAAKPAAKRGTGSKAGARSRASGGSSAPKGAKRTGGSAKGDSRRDSSPSGRNPRSTSAKRSPAAKPTQRRSSRSSQRRGTSR